jgi:predicted RNase H-like HicB family nuclease
MGPIFDGGGLNMTVMSYLDHLDFGLVACSDLIPNVWDLADGLADALEELKKAADTHSASSPATRPRRAAKKST